MLKKLFKEICEKFPNDSDRVTKTFLIISKNYSRELQRIMGEQIYRQVWVKQPHLRGHIIINEGKVDKPTPFTFNSLFIKNIPLIEDLAYQRTGCYPLINRHLGQRKLIMTEIYFLTRYGHLSNNVVYAGSADGLHLPILHSMFPDKRLFLYDPAKFSQHVRRASERNPDKISITQSFFPPPAQDEFYDIVKERFIFISDIRSKTEKVPSDEDVTRDMNLQKEWI